MSADRLGILTLLSMVDCALTSGAGMTKRSYAEAVLRGMDEYLLEQSLRDDEHPTIVRAQHFAAS